MTDPQELGEVLDRAFAAMTAGRPGPAHIQISTNMMGQPCPAAAARSGSHGPCRLAGCAPQPRAERGRAGRHPCRWRDARAEAPLQALAEALDAPVILTANARGAMHGHRLSVPASPSLPSVRALIAAADQVLAIGTELGPTDYDVYAKGGLPDLSGMIRIDICADQLARHPAKMPIKADAGPMMAALAADDAAAPTATAPPGPRPPARPPAPNLPGLRPPMPGQLDMVEAIRTAHARRDHRRRQHPAGLCREPVLRPRPPRRLVQRRHRLWRAWLCPRCRRRCRHRRARRAGGLPDRRRRPCSSAPANCAPPWTKSCRSPIVVWNNAGFREIAEAMRAGEGRRSSAATPRPWTWSISPPPAACPSPASRKTRTSWPTMLATPQDGPRLLEIQVR